MKRTTLALALIVCGLALFASSVVAALQGPPSTPASPPASASPARPASPAPVSAAAPAASATPSFTPTEAKAVVDKFCVTCHNERMHAGNLVLSGIDFANIPAHAESLEKVVRKLGTGSMPPLGTPRPDKATYDGLTAWIGGELDRALAAKPDPGQTVLRRLNRTEYANAIRDVLALDINVAGLLPADNSTHGFDNVADGLGLSPTLMQSYLTAARRVAAVAVGDIPEIPVTSETYRVRPDMSQDAYVEGLPLGTRGGLVVTHTFPADAEYVFNIRLQSTMFWNVKGTDYPERVVLLIDDEEVASTTFGGHEDTVRSFANAPEYGKALHDRLIFRRHVKAGPHRVGVTFPMKATVVPHSTLQPVANTTVLNNVDYTGLAHLETIMVTGPHNPEGVGNTPSRQRIFTCRPASQAAEASCAKQILTTLARRAYRRPLNEDDTRTLMRFFDSGRRDGTFESGIELGLRFILASPDFVFRLETDPPAVAPGGIYRISDVELASRLSFFLWSTIPDEELLRVAGQGKLRDNAALLQQVRRMLADPKSQALVDNFAGQWLYLRNLRAITPNKMLFPDFDDTLRTAMVREVELFFESMMREDRSVVDLMTADYTFVNERLAKHYGIPDVYGSQFRKVAVQQDARRGLLGKGAILTLTAFPTRTSPVIRGKWILENIIGTPPPPPPPDVPTLQENNGTSSRTLREILEEHRKNPTCAQCHRVMDPIGFALEPFDAVGAWRTMDFGTPIDGSGQLANGSKVNGPASLREALIANPTVFVTTMTEKMLTYALGRGLGPHDMPVVRRIVRDAARNDYRFTSIINGIVTSTPFQMRVKSVAEHEASTTVARK